MLKSNKKNLLILVLLISMFIVIPSLLISIQKDIDIPIDGKNNNEMINTRPSQESSVYYVNTNGFANGVYLSGNYAYVADGASGLAVIDISDPTNPGTPVYENTNGYVYGVYVSGDYAYVSDDNSGLAIIDISDPTNPGAPVYENTTGRARGVYISGDYAYVADDASGLAIINISDPTSLGIPIYENTTEYAHDVYVSGDYAYVANSFSGLAVIDISEPIDPETPFYEPTTGLAYGVYISGDYAYVADGESGLAVIDISDPTDPGPLVYENTTGDAYSVYVSGDYAYVADRGSGLAVIDISDPTNPETPVYEPTNDHAFDVYVSGNYAYVASGIPGLAIFDISDPTDPGTPVYEPTAGIAQGVYVSGDYAYVANGLCGLAIINISDPTDPGAPFYEPTTSYALDVYVSGDYAYVANSYTGLAIIDISDPTNPETSAYMDTNNYAVGVFVDGDYVYVADGASGLAVIDIFDPTNPGMPVYENTIGSAQGVCVSGKYAYLADYDSGLAVIQIRNSFEIEDPIISSTPSDFSVEYEYTGQSLSWTATDTNPDTYTIELQGTGIVAGPTTWTSGVAITYNIPDGLSVGSHIYEVTITDDFGNFITDSVNFTVETSSNPVITLSTINHTVEAGYIGALLWWTATDANPDTYTVELQGTGLVVSPTAWTSGNAINYSIPTGFGAGSYIYTVNFTDTSGNFATDSINFTVIDTTNPFITVYASDSTVEEGYSEQSFSWTALDFTPNTYTIELQGAAFVVDPTVWTSNIAIIYDIPDGFNVGSYIYTINITDDSGNFVTDSVNFTVEDNTDPSIISAPSDLTVEFGYTGQSLSWTATDLNPNNYTIDLQGTGTIVGPTIWISGVAITYNIPDGFGVGSYTYTVIFTDDSGNSIADIVIFTVTDTTNPSITNSPSDLTLEAGYTGQSLSWTATDANPDYYEIELQGSGVVAGSLPWTSGDPITYNIPDSLAAGVYVYTVTFTDEYNNFISNSVTVTINSGGENVPPPTTIPFGNVFLVFIGLSVVYLIFAKKRQMFRESR